MTISTPPAPPTPSRAPERVAICVAAVFLLLAILLFATGALGEPVPQYPAQARAVFVTAGEVVEVIRDPLGADEITVSRAELAVVIAAIASQ